MKEKVLECLKRNYAFLAAFFVIIVFHTYMTVNYDSVWFSKQLDNQSYIEYMLTRYDQWTSRLLIETGLLFFTNHLFLWKIVDTAVWMLMLYAMTKLIDLNYKPQTAGIVCLLFFCYDIDIMNTAGWIATINNYIWPFACLCGMLVIIKIIFEKNALNWKVGMFGIFLVIMACDQEQVAAVSLGFLVCCILYLFWKKIKISGWLWEYLAIAVARMVFIMSCPGNANRRVLEIQNSFPEFVNLSLWEKIDIGITSICHNCIFEKNYLFLIFLTVLCMVVCKKNKDKWKKAVAAVPVIFTITCGWLLGKIAVFIPGIVYMRDSLTSAGTYAAGTGWSVVAIFLYTIIMLIVLWEIFSILCMSKTDGAILLLALGAGFVSRFVMCFTPTIWISGFRTAFFWQMALLFASGFLWEKYLDDLGKRGIMLMALTFAAILFLKFSPG